MLKEKSDKDKTIKAIDQVDKEIDQKKISKENTIFIVSNDILEMNSDRFEVIKITADKNEPQFKILEVFDTREAAQTCKDILVDLLYGQRITKGK